MHYARAVPSIALSRPCRLLSLSSPPFRLSLPCRLLFPVAFPLVGLLRSSFGHRGLGLSSIPTYCLPVSVVVPRWVLSPNHLTGLAPDIYVIMTAFRCPVTSPVCQPTFVAYCHFFLDVCVPTRLYWVHWVYWAPFFICVLCPIAPVYI